MRSAEMLQVEKRTRSCAGISMPMAAGTTVGPKENSRDLAGFAVRKDEPYGRYDPAGRPGRPRD
jgi:hypothetical protein